MVPPAVKANLTRRLLENNFVRIQEELQMVISYTETGKILLYALEELLEHQKEPANRLEGETITQIPKLQVPLDIKTKILRPEILGSTQSSSL